jgi:branched-chain amino acid transport system substrate-binding protein
MRAGRGLRRRTGARFSSALLALSTTTAGCSFVANSETHQCETTEDCRTLGPEFEGTVCTDRNVCLAESWECSTHEECIARQAGAPAICRADHTCVAVLSDDCTKVTGAFDDPTSILVGFLGGIEGDFSPFGVPIHNSVVLGFGDIAAFGVGLPGGPAGRPRPFAFVTCNDASDAQRAARHLVERLQVPAIIGPSSSQDTIVLAKNIAVPEGTLIMTPSATSPAITGLDDNNLVWRTAPSDAIQAIPITLLIADLESQIRFELGLPESDAVRLAVAIRDDAYGAGIAELVFAKLVLNGKDATANGKDLLQRSYSATDPNLSDLATDFVDFKPHIVLLLGADEAVTGLLAGIEDDWSLDPTVARPRYILPNFGKSAATLSRVGTDDDLRKRIIGTVPGRRNVLYDAFALHYEAVFGSVPDSFGTANAYDAVYVLAYAMASVRDEPVTGASIAKGFSKIIAGEALPVGPNGINPAFGRLSAGGTLDFTGASGPLDFNLSTGEAPADIDIWCIVADVAGAAQFKSSGQYYDAELHELVGARACP